MKYKFFLIFFAFIFVTNSHCSASVLKLTPEQSNTLVQIVINIVTFLCGLFINPKQSSD